MPPSRMTDPTADYEFEGLPLPGVAAGTTVLVSGPVHAGTRQLGLRLLAGAADEATVLVSPNRSAARLLRDAEDAGVTFDPDRTRVIDCAGGEDHDGPVQVSSVSSPGDLTGIGMRFSDIVRELRRAGIERVRTGVLSVATLLMFGDFKAVSRFVHVLAGRIDGTDGLGVLLVDPANHDERVIGILAQFCGGRVDVREAETGAGHELRTRGLAGGPTEWTAFAPFVD